MLLRRLIPALLLLALAGPGRAAARCDLAIAHVNVVPMSRETVLPDRTVQVQGGRIVAIVKAGASPLACRVTVEGHGRYLLPGLNDLHVHLDTAGFAQAFGIRGAPPVDFPAGFALYLANGVTGVRVMSGGPDILAFRDSQKGLRSAFPRLVTASPMLSGAPPVIPEPITRVVTTPDAGRAAVDEYATAGYDFIKVRDNLRPEVFRAILAQAKVRGLYVDGHISQGQGLSVADVLAAGQHAVAHLDNFALAMKRDSDAQTYVQELLACGCFVSSTLQVETNALRQIADYEGMISRPSVKYVPPLAVKAFWSKPNNGYADGKADPAFFRELYRQDGVLLRAFVAAGVPVVAGTDALNPMITPGESLHEELEAMVESGVTPYQALRTATAVPARVVPGFADLGELAPGKTANAVLVEGNPLKDLTALRAPMGVMINGHWLSRADLARGLDRAAASYAR
ncbi:amidohydrolase family protein [Phenylobacterium sp.]|uniref:amidohydrolase family protein n=1 Tax=Phenylobacterium sp. TaxID=1871053 RepID=UPI002BC41592|nr:amidohydrolase family protein [Phenylobacterium sp.]HLZ76317.1 amidohydrolase family protein [Phenylobacterium sp.]